MPIVPPSPMLNTKGHSKSLLSNPSPTNMLIARAEQARAQASTRPDPTVETKKNAKLKVVK